MERLQAYKARLIVFPRKAGKPKKGDSSVRKISILQLFFLSKRIPQAEELTATTTRAAISLPEAYPAEAPRKITAEEKEFKAFRTLRVARANQRHDGARKARVAKVRNRSALH